MLRLLQGDVGSGKTVVALLAMLDAVEAGAQAALMAPTEIPGAPALRDACTTLAERAGRRDRAADRPREGQARATTLLARLAAGEIGIVVGTHALFQRRVAFKDLALAVIDEQHRFGVEQRMRPRRQGPAASISW